MILDQLRIFWQRCPEQFRSFFGGNKMTKLLRSIIAAAGLSFVLPASQILADNAPRPPTTPSFTSSVDEPGRIPYQFTLAQLCPSPPSPFGCQANLPPVPTGKRLVIQHWSLSGQISSGGTSVLATLQKFSMGSFLANYSVTMPPLFLVSSQNSNLLFAFDQLTQVYVDPGTTVAVSVFAPVNFVGPVTYFVSGYLLDCTVNVCAPIAP